MEMERNHEARIQSTQLTQETYQGLLEGFEFDDLSFNLLWYEERITPRFVPQIQSPSRFGVQQKHQKVKEEIR
jgi:hypothetical protein